MVLSTSTKTDLYFFGGEMLDRSFVDIEYYGVCINLSRPFRLILTNALFMGIPRDFM